MEQVCDMYIKQNSTFVSEVVFEAAASQKNLGIVHTDYKPFYELGGKSIVFVVAEERIHTVYSLII